jgi:hypothetical protein
VKHDALIHSRLHYPSDEWFPTVLHGTAEFIEEREEVSPDLLSNNKSEIYFCASIYCS